MKENLAGYIKTALCSVILVASSSLAYASAIGIYIAPSLSLQTFDDDIRGYSGANPDNQAGFGFAIGYQFNSPWAIELVYHKADAEALGLDVDTDYFHLDGLYQFNRRNRLAPYMIFGLGQQNYKVPGSGSYEVPSVGSYEAPGFDENTIQFNGGLGLRYAFTSNFHVRADARLLLGESEELGSLMNVGLVYVF